MAADDEGTATVTDEAADDAQNRDGTSVTNPPDPKDLPPEIKSLVENARKAERAARREAAEARSRIQEFEDRDKTETQKLAERAEAAERELQETRTGLLRLKVGQAKGLPAELAELLHGADEKEMSAHADRLLAATNVQQRSGFDGGAHQQEPPARDMNGFIRAGSRRG